MHRAVERVVDAEEALVARQSRFPTDVAEDPARRWSPAGGEMRGYQKRNNPSLILLNDWLWKKKGSNIRVAFGFTPSSAQTEECVILAVGDLI